MSLPGSWQRMLDANRHPFTSSFAYVVARIVPASPGQVSPEFPIYSSAKEGNVDAVLFDGRLHTASPKRDEGEPQYGPASGSGRADYSRGREAHRHVRQGYQWSWGDGDLRRARPRDGTGDGRGNGIIRFRTERRADAPLYDGGDHRHSAKGEADPRRLQAARSAVSHLGGATEHRPRLLGPLIRDGVPRGA